MERAQIEARLAARRNKGRRGDDLFANGTRHPGPLTPAAVLVPLVAHDDGLALLLTQRTAHLRDHAGQISFPGGRIEHGDQTPEEAALRETQEEVGLAPDLITVVGQLDTYETRTGFEVFPIVGMLEPGFVVVPDKFEVASVFEVPLSFVLDPRNHAVESRVLKGVERQFYVLQYEQHRIWGATAGMLVNLYEALAGR